MFESLNNKPETIREGIDLQSLEFKALKDFVGGTLYVDGFFFTNSNYGKQVVVVANGYKINMPARAVEPFERIAADKEMVESVIAGGLAITDIKPVTTRNGKTVSFTFTDMKK